MIGKSSTSHEEILVLLGLGGDSVVNKQVNFVKRLNKQRSNNAQIHVFPTLWQTSETYADKWSRLLDFVALHPGIKVVYGISAGASLAMSLAPVMPLETKYHFICGKLRYSESIGPGYRKSATALYESVTASEKVISSFNLSQLSMLCRVGFLDGVLRQRDMRVPSLPIKRIPMINHTATIIFAYLSVLRNL